MGLEEDARVSVERLGRRLPALTDGPAVSAWMLPVLGALHSPVYGSRQVADRLARAGLSDPKGAYLAQRAAPLGVSRSRSGSRTRAADAATAGHDREFAPGSALVTAAFYGFSPSMISQHIPEVWDVVPPSHVVSLTLDGMRELLGPLFRGREESVAELSELLGSVASDQPIAGRPLAAAWADIPATGDAIVDLWVATTVIRESRGDGHIAILVAEGVGPLESHLLARGAAPDFRLDLERRRGWTQGEIEEAVTRMRAEGLLDRHAARTELARSLRTRIERRTDEISAEAWEAGGPRMSGRVAELALELLPPVLTSGVLMPAMLERLLPKD